jgi:hypothetical protein
MTGADPVTGYALGVTAGTTVAGRLVKQACRRHLDDVEHGPARGLVWRPQAAQDAIDFFSEILYLPENTNADEVAISESSSEPRPFLLSPWQAFIVGSAFGWYTVNGFRRFREVYIETSKGSGKALALDTPIPTPAGWTTMGAIQPGDVVFDERGRAVPVVGVSDIMTDHPCYEVVFDDGSVIVADEEHLWFTEQRRFSERGEKLITAGKPMSEWGSWHQGIRTTAQIRDTLRYSNGKYQSANHSVPLAGPLGTENAPLPVSPYVLGVWLGDGDSDCARITVADADAELLEHVAACGESVGARSQSIVHVRTPRYSIGGVGAKGQQAAASLNARLRKAGMFDRAKHIPAEYLRGSVDQRLALLQGLMDTDGYINPDSGACEFCTTDAPLAAGVSELVVSLGVKVTSRESAAKLHGREVSRRWRIQLPASCSTCSLRMDSAARRSISQR